MEIPELGKVERNGLFKRYCEYLEINLSESDFDNFTPLLKGYPEQVTYACSLIKELGPVNAFRQSFEIASYSTYRAGIYLKNLKMTTRQLEH